MTAQRSKKGSLLAGGALLLLMAGALLVWRVASRRPGFPAPGKFPEQLVYVRTKGDVDDAGLLFAPPKETAKPIAVLSIHGWGVNFYSQTYVGIGRALASRAYTTVSGNTRMHDIGNALKYTLDGKRVRGGGYWGMASEADRGPIPCRESEPRWHVARVSC